MRGPGSPETLVALWRDNDSECAPLSSVLSRANRGELPGVGEYRMNYGFPVLDRKKALAAMRGAAVGRL